MTHRRAGNSFFAEPFVLPAGDDGLLEPGRCKSSQLTCERRSSDDSLTRVGESVVQPTHLASHQKMGKTNMHIQEKPFEAYSGE